MTTRFKNWYDGKMTTVPGFTLLGFILMVLGMILTFILSSILVLLLAGVFTWAWNGTVPKLIHGPDISYWIAVALVWMFTIPIRDSIERKF